MTIPKRSKPNNVNYSITDVVKYIKGFLCHQKQCVLKLIKAKKRNASSYNVWY
jgi:hypothetical protein